MKKIKEKIKPYIASFSKQKNVIFCVFFICIIILIGFFILSYFLETNKNAELIKQIQSQKNYPLYPFTLRSSADEYVNNSGRVSLDESGIPIMDYGTALEGAGKQYNPTFIANYALAIYRDYLNNNDSFLLEVFKKQVKWYLDNKKQKNYGDLEYWMWDLNFDNPKFNATAPWNSALSQGRIMCVFLAAYNLTSDPIYLSAAEKTYHSFLVPVSEGGVTTYDGDIAWYEEVADRESPSSKILNGHIAALQGLWTYWKWTGREDVNRSLNLGINAVKTHINEYDAKALSYYCLYPEEPRIYAPPKDYNTLHVHQLLWLYEETGDSIFLDYALKFASYDTRKWNITTAGSTDPIHHGPENLFFEMGTKFWSHGVFPTWIEIDLLEKQPINGLILFGYINSSTPKDFQIYSSINRQNWTPLLNISGNHDQYKEFKFESIIARFVKIIIDNDNGNKNVALTGVSVLRDEAYSSAVSNWESFSSGNLPELIFDKGWKIPEKGWVLIDFVNNPQKVSFELIGLQTNISYNILGSNDISNINHIINPNIVTKNGNLELLIDNNKYRYFKIDFIEGGKGGATISVRN